MLLGCAAADAAALFVVSFTAAVGLLAVVSFGGGDFVVALGVLFTSFGARSIVVGLGVSCVALPADLEPDAVVLVAEGLALEGLAPEDLALEDVALEGAAFAPVPVSLGLVVDAVAAFGVRDRVDPVDLDFEVGRCGDFTILLSLVALPLDGRDNLPPLPNCYIIQI